MTACLLTQAVALMKIKKVNLQICPCKKRLWLASTTLVLLAGLGNSLGIFQTENNPNNSLLAHESPNASSPDGIMSGEGSHDHKTLEIPTGQPVL